MDTIRPFNKIDYGIISSCREKCAAKSGELATPLRAHRNCFIPALGKNVNRLGVCTAMDCIRTCRGIINLFPFTYMTRLLKTVWFISFMLVILFSLVPGSAMPQVGNSDKLQHFAAYAWLAGLYALFQRNPRAVAAMTLVLILVSGGLELLQGFVPNRCGSFGDLAANALGAAVGAGLGIWFCKGSSKAHDS